MRPRPYYRDRAFRGIRGALAVGAVLVVVMVSNGCAVGGSRSDVSPAAQSGACIAEPGAEPKDIDEEDTPENPWPHVVGQETVVYFETGQLTPRYAGFVRTASEQWSVSPCIDARAVDHCPADSNCTTIVLEERSSDGDTDGESEGRDRSGVRLSNKLTFYTGLLDESSDNGALATVTHEMGHALGLVHRRDKDDVMNAVTDDDTDPVPDEVDFHNLLVIYGGGSTHNEGR